MKKEEKYNLYQKLFHEGMDDHKVAMAITTLENSAPDAFSVFLQYLYYKREEAIGKLSDPDVLENYDPKVREYYLDFTAVMDTLLKEINNFLQEGKKNTPPMA